MRGLLDHQEKGAIIHLKIFSQVIKSSMIHFVTIHFRRLTDFQQFLYCQNYLWVTRSAC